MDREDKDKLKGTPEYGEIEKYYDEYHWTIQHNVSVHAYRMNMGQEPIGKVQYVQNTFVLPVHYPVPKNQQWEEGPDKIYHNPSCPYKESGYSDELARECHCGKKRAKPIFEKIKEMEKQQKPIRDKKLESTGDQEQEVPF